MHARLAFTASRSLAAGVAVGVLLLAAEAQAAGSGMPWEQPLQRGLESVQGPVGETAGGFRKMIQIVFGLSIAFAASSFFMSFFSFGGGAMIG